MECKSVRRFQILSAVIVVQILGESHLKFGHNSKHLFNVSSSANSTAFRLFGGKKSKSNKITCGPAQKLEYVITHVPVWKTKCKIVEDKVCEEPKRKGKTFNERMT